ncbi:MAG: hypothetical protein DRJ63_07980 [Thermoprotei archaeon]|nr:MAG: hypothetical protein DRJ63_07980 [Thermoprotei archaeon]
MINFENPYALVLVLPLVLIAVYLHFKGYRKIYLNMFSYYNPLIKIIKKPPEKDKRVSTLLLKILLVVLVALSLAKPYVVVEKIVEISAKTELEELSIAAKPAVVIAIDVSGSMADVIPGGRKIEVAKTVVESFIKKIPMNVDIGLIAFAGHIVESVSVTSDREQVLKVVQRLRAEGGTMYTYPLTSALSALRPYRAFNISAILIFVTDGLPADLEYRKILEKYAKLKIPIYTIFIGSQESGIKETKLIAEKTGGKQYTADSAEKLLEVFNELANTVSKIAIKAKTEVKLTKRITEKKYFSLHLLLLSAAVYLLLCYFKYFKTRLTF